MIYKYSLNKRIGTYLLICPCFWFTSDLTGLLPDSTSPVSFSRLLRFPSGGTSFPTNSPFTPTWDVLPFWSISGTHQVSLSATPWSACLIRSPLCECLSEQSLYLLPSPRSNDIFFGCAWSWSGRPRSLQDGCHFDSHIHLFSYICKWMRMLWKHTYVFFLFLFTFYVFFSHLFTFKKCYLIVDNKYSNDRMHVWFILWQLLF